MPDWLFQILAIFGAAGGVYGAIRFDLGRLHEKAASAQHSASRAHERIDQLIFQRGGTTHGKA